MADEQIPVKEVVGLIEDVKKLFKNGDSKRYYDPSKKQDSGGNTLLIIGAIVTIMVGVFAMNKPISLRINVLQNQLTEMRITGKEGVQRDAESLQDRSSLRTMFEEVETTSSGISARLREIELWRNDWLRTVPAMDATQNEKLRAMEEQLMDLRNRFHNSDTSRRP